MSIHPQPNGGDKPLGNPAVPADKQFVKAFALFNKHSDQKEELISMMNRCKEGPGKELIRKEVLALEKFIPKVSGYLASISTLP